MQKLTQNIDFFTKNERNVRHVFCSHGRNLESHVTWMQNNRKKEIVINLGLYISHELNSKQT